MIFHEVTDIFQESHSTSGCWKEKGELHCAAGKENVTLHCAAAVWKEPLARTCRVNVTLRERRRKGAAQALPKHATHFSAETAENRRLPEIADQTGLGGRWCLQNSGRRLFTKGYFWNPWLNVPGLWWVSGFSCNHARLWEICGFTSEPPREWVSQCQDIRESTPLSEVSNLWIWKGLRDPESDQSDIWMSVEYPFKLWVKQANYCVMVWRIVLGLIHGDHSGQLSAPIHYGASGNILHE